MARPLRIDFPGAWHHAMNRGARHQQIFLSDEDRYDFLDLLGIIHERFGVEMNAYCLMDTHYHLLIRSREGELTRAMHHLDSVYAQRFNRRNGFDGPLFKGRFTSKLVDSDGYCVAAARYIHRNPLDANITTQLLAYRWSSYPAFMGAPRLAPEWLYRTALEIGGLRTPAALRTDTEFRGEDEGEPSFGGSQAVVGFEPFVRAALDTTQHNHETSGQYRQTLPAVSLSTLEETIAQTLSVDVHSLRLGQRGQPNDARLIAVGLAQRICRQSLTEIADRYGYATPKSAGSATSRFRTRMAERSFAIEVERIARMSRQSESEARPRTEERGK